MPKKYKEDASNTLSLTSVASVNWTRRFFIFETLTLSDSIEGSDKVKPISHTLNLTHSATNTTITVETSNQLTLSQAVSNVRPIPITVTSQLSLTQTVYNSIRSGVASNLLNLTQEVDVKRPINLSASNSLSIPFFTAEELTTLTDAELDALGQTRVLRHSVILQNSIRNFSLTSFLQLTQTTNKITQLSVSSHISLLGSVRTDISAHSAESILNFQQTVLFSKSYLLTSTLTLTQSVNSDAIFNRSVSNNLVFSQSVDANILSIVDVSPSYIAPTLTPQSYVSLTYPYVSPTKTITLRAPLFNNVEQQEFRRINRRTRGGTLEIHRQTYWPKSERLIMSFNALQESVAKSFLDFLYESNGKEIGLLDHEGRQWKGIILTPAAKIKDETGQACGFSTNLEFEGSTV